MKDQAPVPQRLIFLILAPAVKALSDQNAVGNQGEGYGREDEADYNLCEVVELVFDRSELDEG